jgi:hypothetical protein
MMKWCMSHDAPARRNANYCVLGLLVSNHVDCHVETVDEKANRCLGGCARHTVARFEDGTHGAGPYCGWCHAVPA